MIKLSNILNEIKVLKPSPPKKYTPEWWLYQLPEPYRTQALTNFRNDPNYEIEKKEEYDSLLNVILYPLEWTDTPEGPYYWWEVYYKLENNEPLTEIKVVKPDVPKPKTASWWFYKLPEPYRKQALTNFKKDEYYKYYKDDKYNNISDALYYGFPWSNTLEEYDYWNDIYYKLKNNEPLTEIKVVKPDVPKPKTASWWFHKLPEPYRTQALTNYKNNPFYNIGKFSYIEYDNIDMALYFGFPWSNSPEGYDYWENIRNRIIKGGIEIS